MKGFFINSMKGYIGLCFIAVLLLALPREAEAQQEILTTQWAHNKLTVNPAYAGGKDMFSARALHRQQWVGLDGRPVTTVLNFHSPLLSDKMGLGLSYVHDKLGVTTSNTLMASYSYRMLFENDSKLSFGISLGLESYKIAVSDLNPLQSTDPLLQADLSKIHAKAGAGIYYYGRNYYFGVSTPNMIPNSLYSANDMMEGSDVVLQSEQAAHIYVMAGYGIEMADARFILKPQVLLKAVANDKKGAPHQLDLHLSMLMFHRLIVGTTFRTSFGNKNEINLADHASADLMMGFYITPQWLISYAYDFTLGSLNDYDKGSHEIMLGFDMNFKKVGAYTPRLF
jgi:type IX secretion system PorP/SprF family membrane protein